MTQTPGSGTPTRPPRVVLFRANAIDSDSRAKKFSLTLARLGYEVHVLSAEEEGASTETRWLGPVQVHPVIMTRAQRDVHRLKLGARRRRQFRIVDWTAPDEYTTEVAELRGRIRRARTRADELALLGSGQGSAGLRNGLALATWRGWQTVWSSALMVRRARWRLQWALNVSYRQAWREWDKRKQTMSLMATTRGVLPEVEDYARSFSKVLDDLAPDIIHAHHPLVLGTAVRAARRRRSRGRACQVVYDARENFAGIPEQERGHLRRHGVLVREEARYIRFAAAVVTVSEPIADALHERYGLPARPTVVLNVPVEGQARDYGPTVRQAAGLAEDVPVVVYSGAVSRARGIDTLIEALPSLPGVHAVVVPVPFPHPHAPELTARASRLDVADRLHFVPPVGQNRLLHYLSGADLGVMPLRTGSANIEQALPNKLFENLHAGLTMVTSDAALMKAFVTEHDLGEVYHDPDAEDLAAAIRRALAHRRDTSGPQWQALCHRYSWQGQEPTIRQLYAALAPAPSAQGLDEPEFPSLTVVSRGGQVPPRQAVPKEAGSEPATGSAAASARGPETGAGRQASGPATGPRVVEAS